MCPNSTAWDCQGSKDPPRICACQAAPFDRRPEADYVAAPMSLLDRRLLITAGKGGVGRSTISAALALAAASKGRRVLVCEVNVPARIPALLGAPPQGRDGIRRVAPGIDSLAVQPDAAMREYALMKLRYEALYKAVFENRWVSRLLHFIPSLPELVMLGKILFHVRERRWDLVVVDAPATGHGITFLGVPQAILDTVPPGAMRSEAQWMRDLLVDPEATAINLVSLPEELPVNETLELAAATEETLRMRLGRVLLNRFVEPRFDEEELASFQRVPEAAALRSSYRAALAQGARAHLSTRYLAKLEAELALPLTRLPLLYTEGEFGRAEIEELARVLLEGGL